MDGSKITTGPQGGQVTSISAYVGAIDPTPANDLFQVALYTDSSGAPGTWSPPAPPAHWWPTAGTR